MSVSPIAVELCRVSRNGLNFLADKTGVGLAHRVGSFSANRFTGSATCR